MSGTEITIDVIKGVVKPLAEKYHINDVYIFGSYARGEDTQNSDIDFLIYGDQNFIPTSVLVFAEELRIIFKKDIDVIEINEVNKGSAFYEAIMRECIRII